MTTVPGVNSVASASVKVFEARDHVVILVSDVFAPPTLVKSPTGYAKRPSFASVKAGDPVVNSPFAIPKIERPGTPYISESVTSNRCFESSTILFEEFVAITLYFSVPTFNLLYL
jgi:hypothetical protein